MSKKFTIQAVSLLFFYLFCFSFKSGAAIHTVTVANFSFSPSDIPNVVLGDVVRFVWSSGFHTTTSTSVPAGATTWNENMNSAALSYDYTVTVPGVYNYVCNFHEGMAGSFTASSSLPVKLSEFKLSNNNNNAVLKWTTESEDNIDYFSVQKSKTGSDFVEIARVPAAGHSSVTKSYTYTDPNSSSSDKYYYYTLAIVDKEGKREFSSVELFKNKTIIPKLIISLSPNPIERSGHLMLKFNADKTSQMNVRVSNMQGRSILETTMYATEGVNNGHLMLGNISAGSYSISFELNGIKETHKIIVK
ncbi:MAG: T9SS type A sorting domain-containing protein [Ginsengibacter sp.]